MPENITLTPEPASDPPKPKRAYNRKPKPEIDYKKELKAMTEERDQLLAQCHQLDMICNSLQTKYENCDAAYKTLRRDAEEREKFLLNLITTAAEAAQRMEVRRA